MSGTIPMLPPLETKRLLLRQRVLADLDACLDMDSDAEVMRYIAPVKPSDVHRAELVKRIGRDWGPNLGHWSIFEKADPTVFLGWALLIPLAGTGPEIELGYRLRRQVWGRGIATEASTAVCRHGFDTAALSEIVAVTHPDNAVSQSVLSKLGFRRDGTRLAYKAELPFFRLKEASFSA